MKQDARGSGLQKKKGRKEKETYDFLLDKAGSLFS
jgi:hypothetical protein